MSAQIEVLVRDPSEKRKVLRKIIETWDRGELRSIIEDSFWDTEAMVDFIMDEDLLVDQIDEIIADAVKEHNPIVKDLWELWSAPKIVAFQDCEHLDVDGKFNFDLLERCRLCARPKAQCEE